MKAATLSAPSSLDRPLELGDAEVGRVLAVEELGPVRPRLGQVVDVGEHRPEALVVDREPGRRPGPVADAVVGLVAGEDPGPVALAAAPVRVARHLQRRLVALRAAAGEVDVGLLRGRDRGQALGELDRAVVGELPEAGEVLEPLHLLGRGLGDLAAAVPDLGEPEAAGGVEVLAPVGVAKPASIALDHHHPLLGRARQVRMDDPLPVGLRQLLRRPLASRRRHAHSILLFRDLGQRPNGHCNPLALSFRQLLISPREFTAAPRSAPRARARARSRRRRRRAARPRTA